MGKVPTETLPPGEVPDAQRTEEIRSGYSTPAVLEAHMWAMWRHKPCHLWGSQRAARGNQKWFPKISGSVQNIHFGWGIPLARRDDPVQAPKSLTKRCTSTLASTCDTPCGQVDKGVSHPLDLAKQAGHSMLSTSMQSPAPVLWWGRHPHRRQRRAHCFKSISWGIFPNITSKRGCWIKRRRGRHTHPPLLVICVAYP